jgi:serine/threonine protein kinase
MDGLRHKNIVEYYANFRFRGDWYIVLEYCGKGDMEQYKKKVGKDSSIQVRYPSTTANSS